MSAKLRFWCVAAGLLLAVVPVSESAAPPKWPKAYRVSGTLRLPYAEITEPFTAYYDASKNRSRVDYYNGSVRTIQLAGSNSSAYGLTYKIAPAFMGGKQERRCFQDNGTKESVVSAQAVLPDLTGFKLIGATQRNGQPCNIWQSKVKVGHKKNSYTMWVSQNTSHPVRYEMMGYDTLLGSHYDKYYLDYTQLATVKPFTNDTFQPPAGMECGEFPGPGDQEHRAMMNPMREFIHADDSHIDEMFNRFRVTHQKEYKDANEQSTRMHIFRQNARFVHSKNRAGLSYSLKVNHLADLDDNEMRMMRGTRHSDKYNGGMPFDTSQYNLKAIPDSVDWRLYGAVSPVKDQAVCGSCWSFGTTGAVEGAYFMKTGELVRLSQQELMDCSWDQGNNACDGGEDFRAYQWIQQNGLASEESYGPYLGQDGVCHAKNATPVAHIRGYVNVTARSTMALKVALATRGPISISIDAAHKSLSYYSSGVYYEPNCGSKPDQLDHTVLAVGYGVINGWPYWLVKNSWSTYWGNNGYVLMSQKNDCGVTTSPTFVLM